MRFNSKNIFEHHLYATHSAESLRCNCDYNLLHPILKCCGRETRAGSKHYNLACIMIGVDAKCFETQQKAFLLSVGEGEVQGIRSGVNPGKHRPSRRASFVLLRSGDNGFGMKEGKT